MVEHRSPKPSVAGSNPAAPATPSAASRYSHPRHNFSIVTPVATLHSPFPPQFLIRHSCESRNPVAQCRKTVQKETLPPFVLSLSKDGSASSRGSTGSPRTDIQYPRPPKGNAIACANMLWKSEAARRGFEPRSEEPKSSVLPLHHRASKAVSIKYSASQPLKPVIPPLVKVSRLFKNRSW